MRARLTKNLGTFTTTKMDPKALEKFQDFLPINAVDWYTYPELETMEKACGDFLLNLFGALDTHNYSYFSSSGSSEAIFLSLLLLKYHAQNTSKSNQKHWQIIISDHSHIAWQKAASCLDIEVIRLSYNELLQGEMQSLNACLSPRILGVVGTLGATTHLQLEPIDAINQCLVDYHHQSQHFIPIHVDAASGGFVVPFIFPDIQWDFRLSHVKAVNVSSHKFGGVYPSLGWLLVHQSLSHASLGHQNFYLGKSLIRYPIQFSHSAGPLAAQHHQIQTLAFEGYQQRIKSLFAYRHRLIMSLTRFSALKILTPENRPSLPGFLLTVEDDAITSLQDLALFLRHKGWHLPVYDLSPEGVQVARVIIRYGFKDRLLNELATIIGEYFSK